MTTDALAFNLRLSVFSLLLLIFLLLLLLPNYLRVALWPLPVLLRMCSCEANLDSHGTVWQGDKGCY